MSNSNYLPSEIDILEDFHPAFHIFLAIISVLLFLAIESGIIYAIYKFKSGSYEKHITTVYWRNLSLITDNNFRETFNVFKNTSNDQLSSIQFCSNITIELSQRIDTSFHANSLVSIKQFKGNIYKPDSIGALYITGKPPSPNKGTEFWKFIATEQVGLILKICDKKEESESVFTSILPIHTGKNFNIYFNKIFEYSIDGTTKYSVVYAVYNAWSYGCVPDDYVEFIKIYLALHKISRSPKMFIYSMNGEGRANLFSCISHYYDFVTKKMFTDPLSLLFSLRVDNKLPLQTNLQYAFLYICVGELMIKNRITKKCLMISKVIEKYLKYKDSLNIPLLSKSDRGKDEKVTPETWWIDFLKNDSWVYSTYLSFDHHRDLAIFQGHFFNIKKSRSKNNYCYDTTRVILQRNYHTNKPFAKTFDNFYNANWIKHPKITQKYILGESPSIETIDDFVELIYQEKIPLLFTPDYYLENFHELLPLYEGQTKYYGIYKVTCLHEYLPIEIEGCHIIKFNIQCSESKFVHEFDQIQYRRWGNKQVPSEYNFLPLIIQFTMSLEKNNPIFVHCRDGLSNSGTFVLTHYMINRLLKEPLVRPKDILKEIRKQRYGVGCIPHHVVYSLLSVGEVLIKKKIIKNSTTKNDYNRARYLFDEFSKKLLRRPQHFNHNISHKSVYKVKN